MPHVGLAVFTCQVQHIYQLGNHLSYGLPNKTSLTEKSSFMVIIQALLILTKKDVLVTFHITLPSNASLHPSSLTTSLLHPYLYLLNPTWLIPFPAAIWDLLSVGLHTILSSLQSSNLFCYMYIVSLPSASASADALFSERRNHDTASLPHPVSRICCPHISHLHNNFLSPSPLHPHIVTSSCITHWKTPFSIMSFHHLHNRQGKTFPERKYGESVEKITLFHAANK